MLARMFSLAVFRISEPDGGSSGLSRGPIVANIGPETAGPGSTVARCKYRNWRIVAVDLRSSQDMLPDLIDQRRDQFTRCADPAGQCRAIEINAFAGENFRLPVKGLVVGVM